MIEELPGTNSIIIVKNAGNWAQAALIGPTGWEIDSIDRLLFFNESLEDFMAWAKDMFQCHINKKGEN